MQLKVYTPNGEFATQILDDEENDEAQKVIEIFDYITNRVSYDLEGFPASVMLKSDNATVVIPKDVALRSVFVLVKY